MKLLDLFVQVHVDKRNVDRDLKAVETRAISASKAAEGIGAAFKKSEKTTTGVLSRMSKKLAAFRKEAQKGGEFVVHARLDRDAYERDLAALKRGTGSEKLQFELGLDTSQATAALQAFKARHADETFHFTVDADTSAADAKLTAFETRHSGQDLTYNADVDTGSAIAQLGALSAASTGLIGAFNLASTTARNVFRLAIPAAILAAAAAFAPLLGMLATVASAGAAAGAGLGLIAAPIAMVVGKLGEYGKGLETAKTAQDTAASSAQSYADAQQGVADAQQGVLDAERQVETARETLEVATEALADAQVTLNDALEDEPTTQASAALDLADARDRASDSTRAYNEAVAEHGRNSEEATDALRDMQRAELDLSQQSRDTARIQARGSDQLNSARDAQEDAARGVSQAEAGVQDALRGVDKAMQQVASAQQAAARAAQQMAEDQAALGAATTALSPALMGLWRALQRFKSAADQAFGPAQQAVARLGTKVLGLAQQALPTFGRVSTQTIGQVSNAFDALVREIRVPAQMESFQRFLSHIPEITGQLTQAAGKFLLGVVNILSEAAPLAADFSHWLNRISGDFLEWSRSEEGRRQIREFLEQGARLAETLGGFLADISRALVKFSTNPAVQEGLNGIVKALGNMVEAAGELTGKGLNSLIDIFDLDEGAKENVKQKGTDASKAYLNGVRLGLTEAQNDPSEGTASYEFGYKLGQKFKEGTKDGILSGESPFSDDVLGRWDNPLDWINQQIDEMASGFTEGAGIDWNKLIFGEGPVQLDFSQWRNIFDPNIITSAIDQMFPGNLGTTVRQKVQGIVTGIKEAWQGLPAWFRGIGTFLFNAITSPFVEIYNFLLGNSIIPDIVNGIKGWFGRIPGIIQSAIGGIRARLQSAWNGIKTSAQQAWNGVVTAVRNAWNKIKQNVQQGVQNAVQAVKNRWNELRNNTKQAWNGVTQAVQQAWNNIKQKVQQGVKAVVQGVKNRWNELKNNTKQAWNSIKQAVQTAWNNIKQTVQNAVNSVVQAVKNKWNEIKSNTQSTWNAIKSALQSAWNAIKSAVQSAVNAVATAVKNKWNEIKSNTQQAWDSIKQAISEKIDAAKKKIEDVVNGIQTFVRNKWDDIKNGAETAWKAIGEFIWKPIENAYEQVKEFIGNITSAVDDAIADLGIGGGGGGGDTGNGSGSSPNTSSGAPKRPTGGARAKGGRIEPGKRYVVGDAPREMVVNPDRPDNVRHLRTVAGEMGYGLSRRGERDAHHRGGPRQPRNTWRTSRIRSDRPQRSGIGEGLGATNYSVTPDVKAEADKIAAAVGGSWNTYDGHGLPGGSVSTRTVDIWGAGGRGAPIGASGGFKAADMALASGGPPVLYIIRQGEYWRGGSWQGWPQDPHYDHTHISYTPNGEPGVGGGTSGGGIDVSGLVQSAWDKFIKPVVDEYVVPMEDSGSKMENIGGGEARRIPDGLFDWLLQKAQEVLGAIGGAITGGNSPAGLTIGEALSQGGWPSGELIAASSTVFHESGGNARAQNPSGARGLMQIMPATAGGVGANYDQLYDPIYNTSTGLKVFQQAGGWGPWVGAGQGGDYRDTPVTGYSSGAMVRREHRGTVHPNEMVLPLDRPMVMRSAQAALGTAELSAEVRALRNTLVAEGIHVRDFGAPASEKILVSGEGGAVRMIRSDAGREQIRKQVRESGTRERMGGIR